MEITMATEHFSASGVKLPIRPKAIAFDLDGTLLDYDGALSPGVEKAVKLMAASGLKVFLITGRLQAGCERYWRAFGLDTPMATCNGSKVGFPGADPIFIRRLSEKARAIIMDLEKTHGLYLNYYIGDSVLTVSDTGPREWYSTHFTPVGLAPSLDDIAAMDPPMKCLCVVEEKDNPAVMKLFAEALVNEADLTESNSRFIEILPPGANKAEGLRQLVKWSGIPIEQFVAVGDGLNDLPMLEAAGFSITFSSGDPRLADHVDMVLPPLWRDGMDLLAKVVLGMTDSGRFLTAHSQRFLRK